MAKNSTNAMAKEIYKEIKNKVNKVLEEVADEIKEGLAKQAASDVYEAHVPKVYERRWTLDKPQNYYDESDRNKMLISITPVAEFNRAYGGWNYGDELGGFMNFGNYWHGYVSNYDHPMPRPYLTNYVNSREIWDSIDERLKKELGIWYDVVDFRVFLGDD